MQHLSNQRKLNLTLCVRLDLNNGGNGGNTLCNGTGVIDASGSGGLKQSQQITSTTFTDYIFNYYSLASFEPYLVIAAIPQIGISSQTILIRKITIEETPPPVSFTLPASLSFQCGSTTPQTFAVTNVYGTTGITNYTWNLGSATNGWLFNGNPAPQAISTGTTNTLTLTPVCGASQNNISATVTANGNNYATNSSIVSLTPPSITISGNSSLCSGTSTYSVSNVPCNGTVTWSASPSGIISLSPNGSSVSVTKVGNGGVTLTAKINACSNYSVHMAIAVGTPEQSYGIYPVDYPSSYCTGENYSYGFEALGASGDPSGYEWIDYGPSQTHYYYNQGDQIQLSFTESGTHTIAIIASNSCGSAGAVTTTVDVSGSCGGWSFVASPNPVSNFMEVSLDNNSDDKQMQIQQVIITDKLGNTIKRIINKAGTKHLTINTNDIKQGLYFIRVFNGKEWKTKSIIKQ